MEINCLVADGCSVSYATGNMRWSFRYQPEHGAEGGGPVLHLVSERQPATLPDTSVTIAGPPPPHLSHHPPPPVPVPAAGLPALLSARLRLTAHLGSRAAA